MHHTIFLVFLVSVQISENVEVEWWSKCFGLFCDFSPVPKWKQIDYNMYYDSHTYPCPLEANLSGAFPVPKYASLICSGTYRWNHNQFERGSDHHWLGKKRCSQEGAQRRGCRRAIPDHRENSACISPPANLRGFSYETKGLESNSFPRWWLKNECNFRKQDDVKTPC